MSMSFQISFFGSSLVSSWWNADATYFRGLLRALHERGHHAVFHEPAAFERQAHRDIADPPWARVSVWEPRVDDLYRAVESAQTADVIIKATGVGFCDDLLEEAILDLKRSDNLVVLWDVDPVANLDRLENDSDPARRAQLAKFDLVVTKGGGDVAALAYEKLGAKACATVLPALDPTTQFPVRRDPRFECDLAFLGNRVPGREASVERLLFAPARTLTRRHFLLAGMGWDEAAVPGNIRRIGYLPPAEHNPFNSSATLVLDVPRDSVRRAGYFPSSRLFEAAGCGACLVAEPWEGLETFLEPQREILLARNAEEIVSHVERADRESAARIGSAARRRILAQHTYAHRALQLEQLISGHLAEVEALS